jgi:outer membrane protein
MKNVLLSFGIIVCFGAIAQDTVTLQHCIDLMTQNTKLTISENKLIQQNEINRKFHNWTLVPSLSGSAGLNTYFGRRVDPFTNTFATSQVNSQSFGMNASMPVFNGFYFIHTRKSLDYSIQLASIDKAKKDNLNLLRLISLYETLCKLQLQLAYSNKRIQLLQTIQEAQITLLKVGRLSSVDTLKSQNTLLTEQLLQIALQKDLRLNEIELNFLIGLTLTQQNRYSISSMSLITTRPIYDQKAELEKLEINEKINQTELAISRSAILPSISLNGNLGTGYSTNNKDYTLAGSPTKSFEDQIKQNLYEGIGIYLSIPILNRGTWLKAQKTYRIHSEEIALGKELKQLELQKRSIEIEQVILSKESEIIALNLIVSNLEEVYNRSLELYKFQRITYAELESVLMDWQAKFVELETKKLELVVVRLQNP